MDELVIGEKRYVSSKRAAEITGYAKDYVGQLCREGYVEAKMVGRSWYVLESSIRAHRFGDDSSSQTTDTGAKGAATNGTVSQQGIQAAEPNTGSPKAPASPVLSWERPVYKPEAPTLMPEIAQPVRTEIDIAIHATSETVPGNARFGTHGSAADTADADAALSDMQTAWKEWFEQKRDSSADEKENEENATDVGYQQSQDDDVEATDTEESEAYGPSEEEDDEEGALDSEATDDGDDAEDDEYEIEVPIQRQREVPEPAHVAYMDGSEGFSEKAIQIPLRKMRAAEQGVVHEERIIRKGHGGSKRSNAAARTTARSSTLYRTILIAVAGLVIAISVIGSGVASTANNPIVNFLGGTSTINK